MNNIKITVLCTSLALSGTASAGWLDFLNQSNDAAAVESQTEQVQSSTAQSIDSINNAVKTAQIASDVNKVGLVGTLVNQLGVTKEQASGGAGALFQVAKTKMTDAAFSKVSDSVPGMAGLLAAAPKTQPASGTSNLLGALAKASGNDTLVSIASLADTFQKLDMNKGLISQFTPILINYVQKNAGQVSSNLLRSALTGG